MRMLSLLAAILCIGAVSIVFASEFAGLIENFGGTQVINVEKSTGDRYPAFDNGRTDDGKIKYSSGNNWVQMWREHTGNTKNNKLVCAVEEDTVINPSAKRCTRPRGSNLVGGHMVKAGIPPHLCNNTSHDVYIIPICKAHNHYTYTGVMTVRDSVPAVKLKNYGGNTSDTHSIQWTRKTSDGKRDTTITTFHNHAITPAARQKAESEGRTVTDNVFVNIKRQYDGCSE